jgi:hypothetical protein
MDNDSKIALAQLDLRAANEGVRRALGDTDAIYLALRACELLAAVVSDQQEEIETLQARLDEDPSTYDLRKGRR